MCLSPGVARTSPLPDLSAGSVHTMPADVVEREGFKLGWAGRDTLQLDSPLDEQVGRLPADGPRTSVERRVPPRSAFAMPAELSTGSL